MDENISKTLSYIFTVFFMLAAITLFFVLYGNSTRTIGLVNQAVSDKKTVYQMEGRDNHLSALSGAHLVGTVKAGLETDICIDTVHIACSIEPELFNYSLIDITARYLADYQLNQAGDIEYILYRKVDESMEHQ